MASRREMTQLFYVKHISPRQGLACYNGLTSHSDPANLQAALFFSLRQQWIHKANFPQLSMFLEGKAAMLLTGAFASVGLMLSATSSRCETADTEREPRQLRVLDSQEVILGPRSIIYNRVETPPLLPQPAPEERADSPNGEYLPTAEEMAEIRRWETMNHVSMFLSCTVYDDQLTEVRFRHEDADITFWSTINFHHLSQMFELQTKDTDYVLMMWVGDSTTEELQEQNTEFRKTGRSDFLSTPPADLLDVSRTGGRSTWRVTSDGAIPPEAQRAIADIHAYFDANREALISDRAEREAACSAHEQWLKDNPPQPKDTVIQFFPIRSSHSPTEAQMLESLEAARGNRER